MLLSVSRRLALSSKRSVGGRCFVFKVGADLVAFLQAWCFSRPDSTIQLMLPSPRLFNGIGLVHFLTASYPAKGPVGLGIHLIPFCLPTLSDIYFWLYFLFLTLCSRLLVFPSRLLSFSIPYSKTHTLPTVPYHRTWRTRSLDYGGYTTLTEYLLTHHRPQCRSERCSPPSPRYP